MTTVAISACFFGLNAIDNSTGSRWPLLPGQPDESACDFALALASLATVSAFASFVLACVAGLRGKLVRLVVSV